LTFSIGAPLKKVDAVGDVEADEEVGDGRDGEVAHDLRQRVDLVLRRTVPTSRKAKPACIASTMMAPIQDEQDVANDATASFGLFKSSSKTVIAGIQAPEQQDTCSTKSHQKTAHRLALVHTCAAHRYASAAMRSQALRAASVDQSAELR
jgi:hypothetical protein